MARYDARGDTQAPLRSFAAEIAIAVAVFTTLVFIGIFWRTIVLVQHSERVQASSYIDLVVNARTWNAGHGGVWVVKGPDSPSNPYLIGLGVDPDTSTVSGTVLTLRNPAVMTNEMSRIAETSGYVRFRLTSLKLVNPENAPDSWERQALQRFAVDLTPAVTTQRGPSGHVLRMMRPLLVSEACLRCHRHQGYKPGDVRGAISLTLPLALMDRSIVDSGLSLLLIYLMVVLIGGVVVYWLVARMSTRVELYESELHILATTDPLTGIANRRSVLERLDQELARALRSESQLGVLELDIDHFKRVNDTYGHAAGDEVLRTVTSRMIASLREYDVAGRLGGEEFLVVAPEVDEAALLLLAERLRASIATVAITFDGAEVVVTTSVGATLSHAEDTAEAVFARADAALYAAKESGRNRVELG